MKTSNSSSNLSKADIISFLALLIMGILVFFGMNFMTLGDRIVSIVVAVLTVVLMTVFVFLAAYAKAQDKYQDAWKKIEYTLVALYVLALVPCYIFTAKFFDIQFDKENVIKQVGTDTANLNKLFDDYAHNCQARANAYQIGLEAMLTTSEGRSKIASLLDIKSSEVSKSAIEQAVSSFSKNLNSNEVSSLEAEKNALIENCTTHFNKWNIIQAPQYAAELGNAMNKYATELEKIYNDNTNSIEKNIPEFSAKNYIDQSEIVNTFTSRDRFSILGLIAVLFLGFLGLVKYLFGERSSVVPVKLGDASDIGDDGIII